MAGLFEGTTFGSSDELRHRPHPTHPTLTNPGMISDLAPGRAILNPYGPIDGLCIIRAALPPNVEPRITVGGRAMNDAIKRLFRLFNRVIILAHASWCAECNRAGLRMFARGR